MTQASNPRYRGVFPVVPRPIRVRRQRVLKKGELERVVEFASRLCEPQDSIVILLDADEDCPRALAADMLARARVARSDRSIRVVVAKMEYEAWFLAAVESITGRRGIQEGLTPPGDPEAIRGAKGWLSRHMPAHGYSETLDQPALTAIFDMQAARAAPSFDKMWRTVSQALV